MLWSKTSNLLFKLLFFSRSTDLFFSIETCLISSSRSLSINWVIFSVIKISFLWLNITCLWSLSTLSNLRSDFLISKFLASTFCWALSKALLIQGWSILSPSLSPSFSNILLIDSEPKILIKSSSKLTKKIEFPSSPCLPDLPLAWLSTLLDSILSVPITYKPPSFLTLFFSSFDPILFFPPSLISTPLPDILVVIITEFSLPAFAIISASFSWFFAFKTVCSILFFFKSSEYISDLSTLDVKTRAGCPLLLQSIIKSIIANCFSFSVL